MEKIIKFTPAFDKSDPDPKKNFGIGAMRVWFYAKGELATVQFSISTGWYLPGSQEITIGRPYTIEETREDVIKRKKEYSLLLGGADRGREVVLCDRFAVEDWQRNPQGWDVGYHSPTALYEGQTPMEECEFFPSPKRCFYDGSSLRGQEWGKLFLAGGTDWLWPELEKELRLIEDQIKQRQEDEKRFS